MGTLADLVKKIEVVEAEAPAVAAKKASRLGALISSGVAVSDSREEYIPVDFNERPQSPVRIGSDELDFSIMLNTALGSIQAQLDISTAVGKVSLRDIAIKKEQSAAVIDAIAKVVQFSHLKEVIEGNEYKFKRSEELDALRPLLNGLKSAARMAERSMQFILEQMELELAKDRPEIERVMMLQGGYTEALENIGATVVTLNKAIQLERFSGGRYWGRGGSEKSLPVSYIAGLDNPVRGGAGGRRIGADTPEPESVPRKLTEREVGNTVNGQLLHRQRDGSGVGESNGLPALNSGGDEEEESEELGMGLGAGLHEED